MPPLHQPPTLSAVRVGILHSQTGTMAISESPLSDAALMAIAQINQARGVFGSSIELLAIEQLHFEQSELIIEILVQVR